MPGLSLSSLGLGLTTEQAPKPELEAVTSNFDKASEYFNEATVVYEFYDRTIGALQSAADIADALMSLPN